MKTDKGIPSNHHAGVLKPVLIDEQLALPPLNLTPALYCSLFLEQLISLPP
jgi:hypothetical protein